MQSNLSYILLFLLLFCSLTKIKSQDIKPKVKPIPIVKSGGSQKVISSEKQIIKNVLSKSFRDPKFILYGNDHEGRKIIDTGKKWKMKNAFLNEYETKKQLAEFILQTERLSMDQKCLEFESNFANYQGRKHSILFNSGGSANLALLQACKNLRILKSSTGSFSMSIVFMRCSSRALLLRKIGLY